MTKQIELTQGKIAIVDDDDYEDISIFKWSAQKITESHTENYYARRASKEDGKSVKIYMHRLITKCPKGMVVDHINGNGLDNRKENLRICTQSENIRNQGRQKTNKTGYKGVRFYRNNFIAQISQNNKQVYLGIFDDAISAAKAYDAKAKEIYGDYANLNFPRQ